MNSRAKGNIGLARAIAYFTGQGYYIFLPMGDQGGPIDLVVSADGIHLQRVQCKQTAAKHHASFQLRGVTVWKIRLCTYSGRTTNVRKRYDAHDFDLLFVATPDGDYLVNWAEYMTSRSACPYDIIFGTAMDQDKIAS